MRTPLPSFSGRLENRVTDDIALTFIQQIIFALYRQNLEEWFCRHVVDFVRKGSGGVHDIFCFQHVFARFDAVEAVLVS